MKRTEAPPVHIDPTAAAAVSSNPVVQRYQASQQARASQYREPRGGGPSLPLPPLEERPVPGMTIADQGRAFAHAQNEASVRPTGIFQTSPEQLPTAGLRPGDLLPNVALSDPNYRAGHGAEYASNQPELAVKYGVIRQGHHIPGPALQLTKPGLSPKTLAGLEQLQKESEKVASGEKQDEANAAPRLDDERKPSAAEQRAFERLDDLDVNMFREALTEDVLSNDKQREIVESRLVPLDLSEYIMQGYVRQHIVVVPGKYEMELKSLTAEEELSLKRLTWQYKTEHNKNLPDRFLYDLHILMTVACGLWSLNHRTEPTHLQGNRFDDELFWRKFDTFWTRGFHLMVSLSVQYQWFDLRVKKMHRAEAIKNG